MEILRDAERPARRLRSPIVAIGTFDGVHLGHRRLFEVAIGQEDGGEAAVLTFDPHPAKVLSPQLAPPLITSTARKLELIEACGIDTAIVQPFTHEFAALGPDEFVERVLVRGLGVSHVVVGYDFTYGRLRAGNAATLAEAGRRRGFDVTIVPAVTVSDLACSSTRVRQFVLEGRLGGAAILLGRPCEIAGRVVVGRGRGRTLGVPTANLALEMELLPPIGVYAAWARVAETPAAGRRRAVVNVGRAPTFEAQGALIVEAHLLDFDGDLYGRRLLLELSARLRGEQRFASPEALVEQIHRDIDRAREVLT